MGAVQQRNRYDGTMIARISIFTDKGTLFSYLSESDHYDGEVPVRWNEEDVAVPDLVVAVLEALSQSDMVPPFLAEEQVIKVTIEEETPKSWVAKHFE